MSIKKTSKEIKEKKKPGRKPIPEKNRRKVQAFYLPPDLIKQMRTLHKEFNSTMLKLGNIGKPYSFSGEFGAEIIRGGLIETKRLLNDLKEAKARMSRKLEEKIKEEE